MSLENWTNEQLLQRWNEISSSFLKLTEEVSPILVKLNKLEKEIYILKEEMISRGVNSETQDT